MNINFSISNQCNCYLICYRNSNLVAISRDMRCTGINIILWSNISKKRMSNSAGNWFSRYLIGDFETYRGYKTPPKWSKIAKITKSDTFKVHFKKINRSFQVVFLRNYTWVLWKFISLWNLNFYGSLKIWTE